MDPTKRFSDRVENYIKYRPGYPAAMVDSLQAQLGLSAECVIADIGSGTGISTELFLRNGNSVFAVEPNAEMREAAERLLRHYPKFQSIDGSAEQTTLPARSVDFIVSAQAFHWFDLTKCRSEFERILKPGGWLILIWNERRVKSPFEIDYEAMLKEYATDYMVVDHRNVNADILTEFFDPYGFSESMFDNYQRLDFEGMKGRLLSSSYVPVDGPQCDLMMQEFQRIFERHSEDRHVTISYDTRVVYGRLREISGGNPQQTC